MGYFEIYTTADSGTNWTRVPAANIPAPQTGEFGQIAKFDVRDGSIWFQTNNGRIFRSADMGLNWQVCYTPVIDFGGFTNFDYAFSDAANGILFSNYHDYYRTSDTGSTFSPYFPASGANLAIRSTRLWYIPESNNAYFSAGPDLDLEQNGSSFSTDDGVTWYNMNLRDANPIAPVRAWFKIEDFAYCIGMYVSQEGLPSQYQFFRHDLSNLSFRTALGLKKFNGSRYLVSPNPAADVVNISGVNVNSVSVWDVIGKLVLMRNFNNSTEVSINISNCSLAFTSREFPPIREKTRRLKSLKNKRSPRKVEK